MHKKNRGFTLIEIMVVVAIIGILSAVGIINYTSAVNKAKIAKTQQDMDTIRKAMLWYKVENGELPPPGDACSAPGCNPNWTQLMDSLVNGKYLTTRINVDAWGRGFDFDDNDCNIPAGTAESWFRSNGQDGVAGNADDIRLTITSSC